MIRSKVRISNTAYLIALLLFAAAAAALAYYLYIYLPAQAPEPLQEIEARPVTERNDKKATRFRITYTFTPDELKRRLISEIVVPHTVSNSYKPEIRPDKSFDKLGEKAEGKPLKMAMTKSTESPSLGPGGKVSNSAESNASLLKPVWVLNVISTEDSQKAHHFVELLRETPYRVYTYKVEGEKSSWYRVRVGFFSTFQEAEAAAALLVKKYQMPRAWILNPDPMEVKKYHTPD